MIFTIPVHEHGDPDRPGPHPHGGGRRGRRETTRVGITSARPGRASGQVFKQMRQFESQLKALPGVRSVSVKPGVGAWQGGAEPTWVVQYRGNGEATKLLARTGKQFDQDAVLLLKGCRGAGCQAATEWVFDRGFDSKTRAELESALTAAGAGGWTFYRRGGKGVLRWVHVPEWSGDTDATYRQKVERITADLRARGLSRTQRRKQVAVTILDRDNYDRYGA